MTDNTIEIRTLSDIAAISATSREVFLADLRNWLAYQDTLPELKRQAAAVGLKMETPEGVMYWVDDGKNNATFIFTVRT